MTDIDEELINLAKAEKQKLKNIFGSPRQTTIVTPNSFDSWYPVVLQAIKGGYLSLLWDEGPDNTILANFNDQLHFAINHMKVRNCFSGIDASNSDWNGMNLQNSPMSGTIFENANFRSTNLRSTDLKKANLKGADLTDADLTEADTEDADFTAADLTNANLLLTNISYNQLMQAKSIRGIKLDMTRFNKDEVAVLKAKMVQNYKDYFSLETTSYEDIEKELSLIAKPENPLNHKTGIFSADTGSKLIEYGKQRLIDVVTERDHAKIEKVSRFYQNERAQGGGASLFSRKAGLQYPNEEAKAITLLNMDTGDQRQKNLVLDILEENNNDRKFQQIFLRAETPDEVTFILDKSQPDGPKLMEALVNKLKEINHGDVGILETSSSFSIAREQYDSIIETCSLGKSPVFKG